jgi:isopentenyl-diphosphate Delta-isomerase
MKYEAPDIMKRKEEHVRAALEQAALTHRGVFENYRVIHNALPEIDLDSIDASCEFLGKKLRVPLMIGSITGGPRLADKINENLARAAQQMGVALALGSAKVAIRDASALPSFQVRGLCPDVPLLANLGLVDLGVAFDMDECAKLVDDIKADALIFHINPVHEALQAEGNTRFSGLLDRLKNAVSHLHVPVVVKEVGHGINANVFSRVDACGVYAIDVAGSGGTSWGMIEGDRAADPSLAGACRTFSDWGVPTGAILKKLQGRIGNARLIASGGLSTGVDLFKSVCLGANLGAMSLAFLKPATESADEVARTLQQVILEFRIAMFSTGCAKVADICEDMIEKVC